MNPVQKRLALFRFLFHKYFTPYATLTRRTSFGKLIVSFDWVGQNIYLDNYDNEELSIYKSLLGKHDHIMDVGANCGFYSLLFSHLAPEGRVYCFEPSSRERSMLEKNIELNKRKNIIAFPVGLGADEKTEILSIDDKNFGMNSILVKNAARMETIKIETLDKLVKTQDLPRLDLIKIDVEGYEHEVLKGALNALDRFMPIVVFESWSTHHKQYMKGLSAEADILVSKGYQLFQPLNTGLRRITDGDRVESLNVFAMGPEKVAKLNSALLK